MIQNLENFVSMAIQGTQVPMYTKHTLFLYFSDFSIFFIWKTKQRKTEKITKQKHVKQDKTMHKTRLTQNMKAKHISNAKTKTRKGKREKVIESLGAFFLLHLGRTFSFGKPLIRWWMGRIEIVQVWKEIKGFEKTSKRSKGGWKLILVSRHDHAIALLSG